MSDNTSFSDQRRRFLSVGIKSVITLPLLSRYAYAADEPVVETSHGRIRGFRNDDVFTFRGVRYGAPTGGANRFLPPRKPAPWAGIHDATEYGYSSPQTNPGSTSSSASPLAAILDASNGFRPNPAESEDCLFLNVWTRSLSRNAKRPVMVWLHGGGYSSGSASILLYDGTHIASRSDAVVVGVNHRLNVFGYTHFAEIGGKQYADSGNAGMLDIIQALQWVHQNIENFGGDPKRVMIYGESGGGGKVSFLLGSPPAQGLFQRAVIESGPGITMGDPDAATKVAEMLLAELGLNAARFNEIQNLPTGRILSAYFSLQRKLPRGAPGSNRAFGPILTPDVLPQHPFEPVASSYSADVPVMVGYNRTEATAFSIGDQALFNLDENGLHSRIAAMFGDDSEKILHAYSKPGATPSDTYFRIATDQLMGYNTILLAERKSLLNRAPAFLYRFDWQTPVLDGKLRSPHGLEMPFVFDNVDEAGIGLTGGGAAARKLATRVRSTWAAFAETGKPDAHGLPHWPPYNTDTRMTMLFNDRSRVVSDPDAEERKAMASHMQKSA